jgi:tetratricopeptide (TPR) repeat protein
MAQDWRNQINSDDPKVRAQAVKELALSGNQENLALLKKVVENDPDPRLREYARKAARHLYESTLSPATEKEEKLPSSEPKTTRKEKEQVDEEIQSEKSEVVVSRADIRTAEEMVQRAFSLHTAERTQRAIQLFGQALELNPNLRSEAFARSVAGELTGKTPDEALRIFSNPAERKELINAAKGKSKKTRKKSGTTDQDFDRAPIQRQASSRTLVQNWLSFFQMTEDFFAAEEGKANHEDTLISVLVSTIGAVVLFLITGSVQFSQISQILAEEIPGFGVNMGVIFLVFLVGTVIITPLSFYANVGLQYLGVRVFGGVGEFKAHVYMLALIQVPTTILGAVVSLISFLPRIGFIAGLAGLGLSIYTIIVMVRSIKVVHDVTTGRAIGGMLAVPLGVSIIGGCIMVIFGSTLIGALSQFQ